MKALLAAAVVAALSAPCSAFASSATPPPPPPPPNCKTCGGPPAPPTPVPTLAAAVGPAAMVVAVRLNPAKVKRGHVLKLSVSAASHDLVTARVRYHRGKPVTYHGTIDGSGKFTKSWRVSKNAPLGKAILQVTVKSAVNPYSGKVSFTVLK